jgi:hypothetical protein
MLSFSDHHVVAALQDEHAEGNVVGLNLATGEAMDPTQQGVYDSFRVLRNCIASATGIASNLLLCDEMLKARQMVGFHLLHRGCVILTCGPGTSTGISYRAMIGSSNAVRHKHYCGISVGVTSLRPRAFWNTRKMARKHTAVSAFWTSTCSAAQYRLLSK